MSRAPTHRLPRATEHADAGKGTEAGAGQALVEFAFVIPIFLLILFAILQLGLLFGGQNSLVNSVRETARYAAPYRVVDNAGAQDTCDNQVLGKLTDALHANPLTSDTASRLIPHVEYNWLIDPAGDYYIEVSVQADYKFPLYVPLVSTFLDGMDGTIDNNLRLSAKEAMRVENEPLAASDTPASCP
jgi:Flp pilus assembly protein TadG